MSSLEVSTSVTSHNCAVIISQDWVYLSQHAGTGAAENVDKHFGCTQTRIVLEANPTTLKTGIRNLNDIHGLLQLGGPALLSTAARKTSAPITTGCYSSEDQRSSHRTSALITSMRDAGLHNLRTRVQLW